jgi:uncharacterized protein
MKLSKLDRLMLINQYTILEKLDPDDETHKYNKDVLINGYTHEYDELVEWIHDEVPEEASKEVWDILQMYRSINFSYMSLEDKGELSKDDVRFEGFDGNNETSYMAYARFVIHQMDRYDELKNEHNDYNTHSPSLGKYRRMLRVWESLSGRYNSDLTLEEIKQILNA